MHIHHLGCLTFDIEKTLNSYKSMPCTYISKEYYVKSQEVKIRFLKMNSIYLELIQPLNPESKLYKLKERGVSFYHLAFTTQDYNKDKEKLLKDHVFVTEFSSEAFDSRRCTFMFNADNHLIELIEE